ncbi:chemotaxis protein CheY [Pseudomonas sp. HLT2-19-2]
MINKALRILIADKHHPQSLSIEKMLNRLGYYCVASVCSFEEVECLSGYGAIAFDLLVINADLLQQQAGVTRLACLDLSNINNIVLYGANGCVVDMAGNAALSLDLPLCVMVGAPEYRTLEARLALIDRQYRHINASVVIPSHASGRYDRLGRAQAGSSARVV